MREIPSWVGVSVMLLGFGMMLWQWTKWNAVSKSTTSRIELRYHLNQFRRRSLVGSMMALTGSLLLSLSWIQDIRAFTAAILLLLVLLVCILILAILDLLYVIVYLRVGPVSHAARAQLISEYQKRKQQEPKQQDESSD